MFSLPEMRATLKIYGASSLANSMDENPDSFHATSGMSLTHPNIYRNLFTVLSNLSEEEREFDLKSLGIYFENYDFFYFYLISKFFKTIMGKLSRIN